MSRASCRTASSLWHGKISPTSRHPLGQRQGGSVPPLPHVETAKIPRFALPCCSLPLVPRAVQFSWPPFLQQLSRLALDQAPPAVQLQPRCLSVPRLHLGGRTGGLPAASSAGQPLARGVQADPSTGWRGGRWKRPFNFPILLLLGLVRGVVSCRSTPNRCHRISCSKTYASIGPWRAEV
jgi:hypothetical protein